LQLRTQRARGINCESVTNRHFFAAERFDRLKHAVFENMKFIFTHVVDWAIVSIDNAHVQCDQLCVYYDRAAFVDFWLRRCRRWLWFKYGRGRRLAKRRRDLIGRRGTGRRCWRWRRRRYRAANCSLHYPWCWCRGRTWRRNRARRNRRATAWTRILASCGQNKP
jgi:hypothetical protein